MMKTTELPPELVINEKQNLHLNESLPKQKQRRLKRRKIKEYLRTGSWLLGGEMAF